MSISTTDLRYITPDADGTLKMGRGTAKADQKDGVAVPFASFKGDVRFYRGAAENVGKGDLLGWSIVAGISVGTMIRIAMSDAEVGQISGSNTIPLPAHDHTIPNDTGTTDQPNDTRNDLVNTGSTIVASRTHLHQFIHDHNGTTTGLTAAASLTLNPQAIAFYLIEYVGVS